MTDKELNKEICKELQQIAGLLINSCKVSLKEIRTCFLTRDLLKLYDEKPWIFRAKFDSEYQSSVCVGDFNCTFRIGSIFQILSKFEKLSGTKETVFQIYEDQNKGVGTLDVIIGELSDNMEKVKATRYTRNENGTVNRNVILTKISDVVYVGDKGGSGCFDTYLKTISGIYYVGSCSMERAKSITIDLMVSIYVSRIESSGSFGLIDLKIIGDILPDRLNEAKELRIEWLNEKEAFDRESKRLKAEAKEKAAAEGRMRKEADKNADKSKSIAKGNSSRLEKRLAKLVRYDGELLTVKEYLYELKNSGYAPFITEKSSVQYNRNKFNRMGYSEQQEYERKIAMKVPMYIAQCDKLFAELSKLEFDYFSSLFVESVTPVAVSPSCNEESVDVSIKTETPGITEQVSDPSFAPGRNIVCIECETEDIQDYWDYLSYVPDTSSPDPVYLDGMACTVDALSGTSGDVVRPPVYLSERVSTVLLAERLVFNYVPERLCVITFAPPHFLVTNKGMYYLIA